MTFTNMLLNVPVLASGTGTAQAGLGGMRFKAVTIYGTFSATVSIEISMDGTNFAKLGALTAAGMVDIPMSCLAVRVVVSGWASGQPIVRLGGAF